MPKLLLRWGGRTLLEHVLDAWRRGGVERRIVVLHGDDRELAELARNAGAEVVMPESPPAEMKASVQAALAYIEAQDRPDERDLWLLAPADMPGLNPEVVQTLVSAARTHPGRIIAPTHSGRRGHPVLFPWRLVGEVQRLGHDEGINRLLAQHAVVELPVDRPEILVDVDTPEDYRRLTGREPDAGA